MTASQLYQAVTLLHQKNVPRSKIIINDRVDVAWAQMVSGVQLGYQSLDTKIVKQAFPGIRTGKSVHSFQEAKEAEQNGADYVIYGHIFQTKSKPNIPPKGVKKLRDITMNVNLPVIAIGGITPANCDAVLKAGARGIAVMSGVLEAENPIQSVKEYCKILKKGGYDGNSHFK
jgi:thiazole tautomerase (transcriptional regulator TenI)